MSRQTKTITNIQTAVLTLSTLSVTDLEASTVKDLRSLMASTGATNMADGSPICYARKSQLVSELNAFATKQRLYNESRIDLTGEVNTVQLMTYQEIVSHLKVVPSLVRRDGDEVITKLASDFRQKVCLAYPDTSDVKRFNVRLARQAELLKKVKDALKDSPDVLGVFDSFRQKVWEFSNFDVQLKMTVNESNKNAREEQSFPIRCSQLLEWCQATVVKSRNWREVVVALALLTGRRMNELLCTKTTFEVNGEHSINCYGLSKSHGDVIDLENITVLCPAVDIVNAINWLRQAGKYCEKPEEVNKKYAKELSQLTRELVSSFNVIDEEYRTKKEQTGREVAVFSFHSLRKAYIELVLLSFEGSYRSRGKEAGRLLGHQQWQTAADNYKDVFVLSDGEDCKQLLTI